MKSNNDVNDEVDIKINIAGQCFHILFLIFYLTLLEISLCPHSDIY